MQPGELFRKTWSFTLGKMLLGTVMFLISLVLLLLLLGIGQLFSADGIFISFLIWLALIRLVHFLIMHYFGYLLKAGHIAVLTEAVTTGYIPSDPLQYGRKKVQERFLETHVYWAVDQLVSGAVKQIQRGISKLGNAFDFIPGMSQITQLASFFVELSLGYIDECCLGYTFFKSEQGAFKSSCDGVVLYAQNIKPLLKNAALTMLKVILLMMAITLILFIPLKLLFDLLHWSPLIAFALSCYMTWILRISVIDSYILCCTLVRYMELAAGSVIHYDLYSRLCDISSSFRKLWNKGQRETVKAPAAVAPRYCRSCGAPASSPAGYCSSCGQRL